MASLREGAGWLSHPEILTVRVHGPDRLRFLNGMLSTDVEKLTPGQVQSSIKASNKGRIEGLVRVRMREDDVLLDLEEVSAGRVAGELVKFVVMDDVQLQDASAEREVTGIYGPEAPRVLGRAGLPVPGESLSFETGDDGVVVVRDDRYGVPGFEVHASPGAAMGPRLEAAGATEATREALEVLRVEAGRVRDGIDVDVDTIPLEARLDEAVDLNKGCFIGQEVIARATHRGGVRYHLIGLLFDDELPPSGAELWAEEGQRACGEITSVVRSPTLGRGIGLGYARTEQEAPGTRLEARWDGGAIAAEVAALPFLPPHPGDGA